MTSWDWNTRVTSLESHSSQRWFQPLLCAIFIAVIAPISSAKKMPQTPKFEAKQPRSFAWLSLNIPPQAEGPGLSLEASTFI
jgi:hypothetical protein